MNKLKELQEKLGAVRKKLNQFTNDRAEKLSQLTALSEKDELKDEEEATFNSLTKEIDQVDKQMKAQQIVADNLTQQISQERINGDNPANGSAENFQFHDTGSDVTGEEKELKNFSVRKAIQSASKMGEPDGFEKEVMQDGLKELSNRGLSMEGNLYIPEKVLNARGNTFVDERTLTDRRIINALTSTGGSAGSKGGVTIQDDVLTLIDILRKKLPFVDSTQGAGDSLGATMWAGLDGTVTFPAVDDEGDDPAVKAENATADEVDPTFDDRTLAPKRLPAFAEYSRQLLLQSTMDVENWMRNHLMYKVSKSMNINIMDFILALAGTNSVENGADGGELTWAKVVEFETLIADADAEEEERFAFLTNAKVRGALKTTEMASNTAQFIWDKDANTVNSYPAFVSSVVPKNLTKANGSNLSAAVLANWASLYLGMWGGIDMLVNPYTKAKEGMIEVNVWTFFDRAARHPQSFSVSKDIVTP